MQGQVDILFSHGTLCSLPHHAVSHRAAWLSRPRGSMEPHDVIKLQSEVDHLIVYGRDVRMVSEDQVCFVLVQAGLSFDWSPSILTSPPSFIRLVGFCDGGGPHPERGRA